MSGPAVHVLPAGDLIDHDEAGLDCLCGPSVEPVVREDGSIGWLIAHHSLDGREHHRHDHDRATCPACSLEHRGAP